MNKNQYLVLREIHDFVNAHGGHLPSFYIGVTDNPISMLRFHGVKILWPSLGRYQMRWKHAN